MKKSLSLILGLALASSMALAEKPEGGRGKGDPEQRMQRMQQHLGLSEEQMSQMREIKANGGGREEMRGVLSKEQQTKMREYRKSKQAQHRKQPLEQQEPSED
jgi:hypothetical protein